MDSLITIRVVLRKEYAIMVLSFDLFGFRPHQYLSRSLLLNQRDVIGLARLFNVISCAGSIRLLNVQNKNGRLRSFAYQTLIGADYGLIDVADGRTLFENNLDFLITFFIFIPLTVMLICFLSIRILHSELFLA